MYEEVLAVKAMTRRSSSIRAYFGKLVSPDVLDTQPDSQGGKEGGTSHLCDVMPQAKKSKPPSGRKKRKRSSAEESESKSAVLPVKNVVHESRLWVEKHFPNSPCDLIVHSKKVADVRAWLESRLFLHPEDHISGSRVLVLTGPPGAGKSAVIRSLGKIMGLEFLEWKTPTPTHWQEHLHQNSVGSRYMSKLDEFEMFLEKARKFPTLPVDGNVELSASSNLRGRVKVLLLEDIPLLSDPDRVQKLCRLLHILVVSACFITVIIMTDLAEDSGGRNARSGGFREIQQTLEGAGATKIVFNPITANAIKKLLSKIAAVEKCCVFGDSISSIAESCGGDLRHAISSLQFLCLGNFRTWATGCSKLLSDEDTKIIEVDDDEKSTDLEIISSISPSFERGTSSCSTSGRDNVLSHFHALGKFLHNKRHNNQEPKAAQESLLILNNDYRRCPLNMDAPEQILSEAQIEFSSLIAFLHENVLQFVDDNAVDDVVDILGYLSDADTLLGRWPKQGSSFLYSQANDVNPSQIASIAAGSVAARGVLFANAHLAPCKWQSLRGPALWQVERHLATKKDSMSRFQSTCSALGVRSPVHYPPQTTVSSQTLSANLSLPEVETSDDVVEHLLASCITDFHDVNDDFFSEWTATKKAVLVDRGTQVSSRASTFSTEIVEDDDDDIEDDDDD